MIIFQKGNVVFFPARITYQILFPEEEGDESQVMLKKISVPFWSGKSKINFSLS